MKKLSIAVVILFSGLQSLAQKRSLTIDDMNKWPDIRNEQLSPDGQVAMYRIYKQYPEDTLVVQSVDKRWTQKFVTAVTPTFSANSQWVFFKRKDSLVMYDIRRNSLANTFDQVATYKIPESGNGQWLAMQLKSKDKKLVLRNLRSNNTRTWDSIAHYQFSHNGKTLLLQTSSSLLLIDLKDLSAVTLVSHVYDVRQFVFDQAGDQLAFFSDEWINEKLSPTLRYYKKGMDSAVVRITENTPGLGTHRIPAASIRFSPNGRRIFFYLKKAGDKSVKAPLSAADVNIWHYNDNLLQSEQAATIRIDSARTCTGVLNIEENTVFQLDQEDDLRFVELADDGNGDFALLKQNLNFFAGKWKESTVPSFYIIDIRNGERKKILTQRDVTMAISPTGKYVIWYDPQKQTFLTYETVGGQVREITSQLAGTLVSAHSARGQGFMPVGIAGWLPNDLAVVIYDEFDLWKVDPSGKKAPVNLTNGYGRKNNIMLRTWNKDNSDYAAPVLSDNVLLLVAFEVEQKKNGFFKANLSKAGDPVKLSLDPCLYYAHLRFNNQMLDKNPITKAEQTDAWLVRRTTSSEYPNIYFTRDFKNFVRLSDVHPEQSFNWLTTELVNWEKPDGTRAQGVLYKPENFDSTKKYPVLFYFYERLSYRLHQYLFPELSSGSIDIPFYVSNGYLVVTPDISYTPGNPGESVYNAVISCARHFTQMPWVDSERMGMQGHSFGGYQVNYLVSHSNMFAAAQESSGASDFISYYNGFYREHSAQFYFEYGQGRLGHTLWQKPELYIQNSPIFKADQVQTPLLIMHNSDDGEVPFQQGIEWYTALRRLGKKVWMLQYDREHHTIDQFKNKRDFTIRTAQFFDHYLKGVPAPKWMVSGIPANAKGKVTGLELSPDAGGAN